MLLRYNMVEEFLKATGAWNNIQLHERDGNFGIEFSVSRGETMVRCTYTVQECGDGCCSHNEYTNEYEVASLPVSNDAKRYADCLVAFDGKAEEAMMPAVWFDHPDLTPYERSY